MRIHSVFGINTIVFKTLAEDDETVITSDLGVTGLCPVPCPRKQVSTTGRHYALPMSRTK